MVTAHRLIEQSGTGQRPGRPIPGQRQRWRRLWIYSDGHRFGLEIWPAWRYGVHQIKQGRPFERPRSSRAALTALFLRSTTPCQSTRPCLLKSIGVSYRAESLCFLPPARPGQPLRSDWPAVLPPYVKKATRMFGDRGWLFFLFQLLKWQRGHSCKVLASCQQRMCALSAIGFWSNPRTTGVDRTGYCERTHAWTVLYSGTSYNNVLNSNARFSRFPQMSSSPPNTSKRRPARAIRRSGTGRGAWALSRGESKDSRAITRKRKAGTGIH